MPTTTATSSSACVAAPATKPNQTIQQMLAKYRNLTDEQFVLRLQQILRSVALSPTAITTHVSSLNQLLCQLQGLSNRAQFAPLGELILRPSACGSAGIFSKLFPDHSQREKEVSTMLSLLKYGFAGLQDNDKETITAEWRAVHREARMQYKQQKETIGYGGDQTKLPDMDAVRRLIASLPRGDRTRLALIIFASLPWKGKWQFCAPLLNLGAVRVYLPSCFAQAPTREQMCKQAQLYIANNAAASPVPVTAKPGAAGWLVLHPKDARKDTLTILLGDTSAADEQCIGIQTYTLPKPLSEELRQHYLPPRHNQPWLFTDFVHAKVAEQRLYLYTSGRDAFLKSINDRFLRKQLKSTLNAVKVAAVREHQTRREQQQQQTYADDLQSGAVTDEEDAS
jgi:hypothetical protein